jgi:hypothetical protein
MIRLIRLFEEETGYIYPKNYREWMEWHPKYHNWLELYLVKLLDENKNNCNCAKRTFEDLK